MSHLKRLDQLFDKEIEGFGELFRFLSFKKKLVPQQYNLELLQALLMAHIFLFYQEALLRVKMPGKKFYYISLIIGISRAILLRSCLGF